ncbi:WbqC family protein [Trinickia sp. LjRoot230]|uniref:WbqC family protein n=1 Tax=Trinickia sp. LjRoot230 TaxID=3342288 RepID=UPI003ECEFF5A
MKLGIMQPYFFPYFGHFALIAAVDEWIVFDVTQYTPKTWMNRNRILHPNPNAKETWQYLSVPLANGSISIRTHEARVLDLAGTQASMLGKLSAFRRHAPFYAQVSELVREAFAGAHDDSPGDDSPGDASLVALNVSTLRTVCRYLGMPFSYRICSTLELEFPQRMEAGDWAPFICEALGATGYVNPASGRSLFDPARFARIDVALQFAEVAAFAYDPAPYRYEPHLSIIDVLLWNPPERVAQALRSHLALAAA